MKSFDNRSNINTCNYNSITYGIQYVCAQENRELQQLKPKSYEPKHLARLHGYYKQISFSG